MPTRAPFCHVNGVSERVCLCACACCETETGREKDRDRKRDRELQEAEPTVSFIRQNRNNFKNILRIYLMTNDTLSHKIADPYFTFRNRHTIFFQL